MNQKNSLGLNSCFMDLDDPFKLFKINEILGMRIASSLNLSFYHNLMEKIRHRINDNSFDQWSKDILLKMKIMKGM